MPFPRLSIRRRPTTREPTIITPYHQSLGRTLERENALQSEVQKLERELYNRDREEERYNEQQRLEEQKRQFDERQRALEQQEAENRRQEQLRKTTPDALLHLQDLIRTRHELDLDIWRNRHVNRANQDVLIQKGKRADEILQQIYNIVDTWSENDGWDAKEWEVASKIKYNLESGNQRVWGSNPPWNE